MKRGGRYSPPGVPVVNFASEAGLAVLVALRYLPGDPRDAPDDYVLGWTEVDVTPEEIRADGEDAVRESVAAAVQLRRVPPRPTDAGAPLRARGPEVVTSALR